MPLVRRPTALLCPWLLALLVLAACGEVPAEQPLPSGALDGTGDGATADGLVTDGVDDGAGPGGDTVAGDDLPTAGDGADPDGDDAAEPDTGGPACPGGAGCPCQENTDCDTGFCVDTLQGAVCTQTCSGSCPAGFSCKNVATSGSDVASICVAQFPNLCEPCNADADCAKSLGADALCIPYGAGAGSDPGAYCGGACSDTVPCPEGYACSDVVSKGGAKGKQCQRTDLQCPCSAKAVTQQLATTCSVANELGTCPGARTCSDTGLSACDAPAAASETCDGVDQDCDGQTDEGTCDDGNPCTTDGCDGASQQCTHAPLAGPCDDGNLCTVSDTCLDSACKGQDKSCDDGNPCTDDTCDVASGCKYGLVDGPCTTANPCEVGATCQQGECLGGKAKDCDDDNPCTVDICDSKTGACTYKNVATACDDGNACTSADTCDEGLCLGKAKSCDDKNPCTEDTCDAKTGCKQAPNNDFCDDGNFCTDKDKCVDGLCAAEAVSCNDGNPCTNDTCDPKSGCKQTPLNAPCDDGNACTQGDVCADSACGGTPVSCDDKNPCTDDTCDAATGCKSTPNAVTCDDANACSTGDTCKDGLCVGTGGLQCDDDNPCTTDSCLPGKGCQYVDNFQSCDDGDPCTEGDKCGAGKCAAGKPVACTDGNPCTDDACDSGTGACGFAPNAATCNDGNACTLNDGCQGGGCQGQAKACDDDNPCTDDTCDKVKGTCVATPNAAACDDGTACTQNDKCGNGQCKGALVKCDDENPCTDDSCDKAAGCIAVTNTNPCNDGNACTGGDKCADGGCKGQAVSCDDGNGCTEDVCNTLTGCANDATTSPCDDGNACTSGDKCGGAACTGAPVVCDDKNPCTTDSCDKAKGCVFTNNTLACDDGTECTAGDKCGGGKCAGAAVVCDDKNPCTTDTCDKVKGCVYTDHTQACDDGNKCTGGDVCGGGSCVGTPISCDDANVCTTDGCQGTVGCTHVNNTATCSDGNACTTGDKCGVGKCVPGVAVQCDDGNPCTTDACDKVKGCTHTNNTLACDDKNACTNNDVCVAGACKGSGGPDCDDKNPCTTDTCTTATGCQSVNNTLACSDGSACTTGDKCASGKCVPGAATVCDDKNPCTSDSCDPAKGCVNANNTLACSDGSACTVGDKCALGKCVPGAAAKCDDGNPCTNDSCDPAKGCVNAANTFACNDGNACTTNDVCAAGKCTGGVAPKCNDGNPCTTDSCDTVNGCVNAANTLACSDGNACTTADKCAAGKCVGGPALVCDDKNPCTNDSCDATKGCFNLNNTATCDDGDGCTSGEKCGNGACGGGVAKVCDDANPCTNDSCDKATGSCVFALNAACAVKTLPYTDPIDCGGTGWTASAPSGSVGWGIDATPATPGKLTGSCSLNYNDGAGYPGTTTGTATGGFLVDAAGAAKITLAVHSYNGTDPNEIDNTYDKRLVEASVDGFKTVAVSVQLPTAASKNAWVLEAVDLSALAGKKFQVRFRFVSGDAVNNAGAGWFVDEVNLYAGGVFKPAAGVPVVEPFAAGNANGWQFSAAVGGVAWGIDATAATPGKLDGDASLNFNDGVDFGTNNGVKSTGQALSPVVDLTGLAGGSKASAVFRSWFDSELSNSFDKRFVEVSADAFVTATTVQLDNTKGPKGWGYGQVDLSAYVGKKVRLRFRFDSIDAVSNTGAGWFVDALQVAAVPLPHFTDGIVCSDKTKWTLANAQATTIWAIDATNAAPGFESADCSLNFNNGTSFTCPSGTSKVSGTATSTTFTTAAPPAGQKLWLVYRAWLGTEAGTTYDVLTAEISDHGYATAANIVAPASKAAMSQWTTQKVDITALAGKTLQVRFHFDSKDCVSNDGKGVFVDDVTVQAGP